jgi:hypothetical protein
MSNVAKRLAVFLGGSAPFYKWTTALMATVSSPYFKTA